MGIGSVTSMNSMSGMQMNMARSTDSKSKNIKNEITGIQQQMQQLSSKEELSVDEKTNERKKLQKEIFSLNTELKQHQDELLKSQRREILMAELQKDKEPTEEEKSEDKTQTEEMSVNKADEKKLPTDSLQSDESDEAKVNNIDEKETKKIESEVDTDIGLSHKETHAIVSADNSVRQAARQGTVIARIRDGIVILKGEINQDEKRGVDTEKKHAELEKMEKKEQRAMVSQFSVLGEANKTMKSAVETKVNGTKNSTQVNTENNAFIKAFNLSKENNFASQQRFYISIGN